MRPELAPLGDPAGTATATRPCAHCPQPGLPVHVDLSIVWPDGRESCAATDLSLCVDHLPAAMIDAINLPADATQQYQRWIYDCSLEN